LQIIPEKFTASGTQIQTSRLNMRAAANPYAGPGIRSAGCGDRRIDYMTDAYIIENAGQTAGIVVAERGGLRFYSSDRLYDGLDGTLYRSVRTAHKAVAEVQRLAAEAYVQGGAFGQRQVVAGHRAAA
jgi:hypothetical protein